MCSICGKYTYSLSVFCCCGISLLVVHKNSDSKALTWRLSFAQMLAEFLFAQIFSAASVCLYRSPQCWAFLCCCVGAQPVRRGTVLCTTLFPWILPTWLEVDMFSLFYCTEGQSRIQRRYAVNVCSKEWSWVMDEMKLERVNGWFVSLGQ